MGTIVLERHLLSPFCFLRCVISAPPSINITWFHFQVTNPISSRSVNLNRRPHLRDVSWVSWGFGGFPHEWKLYKKTPLNIIHLQSFVMILFPCWCTKTLQKCWLDIKRNKHNCWDSQALKDDATFWPKKKHAGFLVVLKSCLNAIEMAVCTKEMPDSPEFNKPTSSAKAGGIFLETLLQHVGWKSCTNW